MTHAPVAPWRPPLGLMAGRSGLRIVVGAVPV
jgi:hypothetical protein